MRQKEQSLLAMPDSLLRKAQVQRWWLRGGVQDGRTKRPREVPRELPEAVLGERLLEERPQEVLAAEAAGEENWLGESFGRSPSFVARVACPEVTLALRGPADPEELLQQEPLEPFLLGEELLVGAQAEAIVGICVAGAPATNRPLWPQPPAPLRPAAAVILGQDWLL